VTCIKALKAAADKAVSVGLTTIHALEWARGFNLLLKHRESLPVRIKLYAVAETPKEVDDIIGMQKPEIGVKIITDGAFGAHTAALFEPYSDNPSTKGTLIYTDEELNKMVMKAHKAGLQLALHAVGEAAIEQVLNVYEKALKVYPKSNHRHRIEHFELPTQDQIKRVAKLGVTLAMQPQHLCLFNYKEFIGDRVKKAHPYKLIQENNILVAGGSDSPVALMDPLFCVHCLVNMPEPDQRVSIREALRINTINGAKMGFEEHVKGTIEAGKLADLVVISDDPYSVEPEKIKDIKVLMTIVGGKIVYTSPEKL
jgi:predicted amidohydrolase YtcJ